MTYAARQIVVTITLQAKQGVPARGIEPNQNPTFAGTNSNVVRIQGGVSNNGANGARISARITRPGGVTLGQAEVQIYNLPLSFINQLGTLGYPYVYMVGANFITIEAGDAAGPLKTVFKGTIFSAYADFSGAPECIFNISAQSMALTAVSPATPSSFSGTKDVATIMAGLAKRAGLSFTNNGVTAQLSNPYLSGSLRDQIRYLAKHSGVSWQVDDVTNTLLIWPKNGNIAGPANSIPLIAPPPNGNMVGYPTYTQQGLKLKTEFTTDITYGSQVKVQSSLQQANGTWTVFYIDHDLECQAPDGPWYTNLEVAAPGYAILPPGGFAS